MSDNVYAHESRVARDLFAAGEGNLFQRVMQMKSASQQGEGVGTLSPGLAVFGLGMGMIFVPLFSIVLGGIADHEVGSATGLLTSVEQLGASLGIAGLATVFFHVYDLEAGGPRAAALAGRHLAAAQDTLLMTVGLVALAWALAWLLPRHGRTDAAH